MMGMFDFVGKIFNDITGASDAYENSMKAWHAQNEYNTPAAQIERMKAAGIDVNPMIYAVGNGSMSSGNATGAPGMSGSGVNPLTTVMDVMSGISGLKTARKQREAVDVQNRQTEAATENTFANTARIQAESKNLLVDADIKRETARQMKWENDFMERYGYRPVQPEYGTHLKLSAVSGNKNEFTDDPKEFKSKVFVKDLKKPSIGSNVISVPKGWRPQFIPTFWK